MNANLRQIAAAALDKAVPRTYTCLDHDDLNKYTACLTDLVVKECIQISLRNDDPFTALDIENYFKGIL